MKRLIGAVLIGIALSSSASAHYYLFEKEQVVRKYEQQLPFKFKDFGEYWELGKFKDKNTALLFQNEFLVRFGFVPKVAHFGSDENFREYIRFKEAPTAVNLLRDLEILKRKIKAVKDPKFNSCYFINRINAVERCIIKEFKLKANFPKLVERIYYQPHTCLKVKPANGEIGKAIVANELKRIIDKYSVYQKEKGMLEEILKEVYSTF